MPRFAPRRTSAAESSYVHNSESLASAEKPLSVEEQSVHNQFLKWHKAETGSEYIDFDDFEGVYDDRDQQFLAKVRNEGAGQRKTQRSEILEYLLREHIELSDWFGPNAKTLRVSDYDDRFNHTDFLVEFENEEGRHSHLRVDATATNSSGVIDKKLSFVEKDLKKGQLGEVKYYEQENEEGGIQKIKKSLTAPRVILSLLPEDINHLCYVVAHDKKEVAKAPEQLILLEQILSQLQMQFIGLWDKITDSFKYEDLANPALSGMTELVGLNAPAFFKKVREGEAGVALAKVKKLFNGPNKSLYHGWLSLKQITVLVETCDDVAQNKMGLLNNRFVQQTHKTRREGNPLLQRFNYPSAS